MRHVDAVGAWCALGYAALAFVARQPGEPDLAAFFVLVGWTGLPVFGLYLYFRRRGEPFPVGRLIFWAVVFRICGLAGGPFYEDDFYRYLWDGYRFATTGTPYGAAPEAFFVDPARAGCCSRASSTAINYPELPTIYAPDHARRSSCSAYWLQPASVVRAAGHPDRESISRRWPCCCVWRRQRNVPALRLVPAGRSRRSRSRRTRTAPGACLLLAAIVLARERAAGPPLPSAWGWPPGSKTFGLVLVPAAARQGPLQILAPVRRHPGCRCMRPFVTARRDRPRVAAGVRARMGVQLGAVRAARGGHAAALRGPTRPGPGVRGLFWGWYCLVQYWRGRDTGRAARATGCIGALLACHRR